MRRDILIVVDMQKDFTVGALANPTAKAIVPRIAKFIEDFWSPEVIATFDTHDPGRYANSHEGRMLPVGHCFRGTEGWQLEDEIRIALERHGYRTVEKYQFGYTDWDMVIFPQPKDTIYLVGTDTGICVLSQAIVLRALFPENDIVVISDLCAGLSKEEHETALEAMKMCHIEVKNEDEVRKERN